MGGLFVLALFGALAVAAVAVARSLWIFEAHEARSLDGSPVLQLEMRVARRQAAPRGWRLYCSVVLAHGQDRATDRESARPNGAIPYGKPPASVL